MAKTYKNLYTHITNYKALWVAWERAQRGKRYTSAAATFGQNLGENLQTIQDELQSETYQPGQYRHFTVHEPMRRKISAAPFRDRVVHHALVAVAGSS